MDIYFSSDQEVICFCEHLFSYNKNIELHWKTTEEWGNHLKLTNEQLTDSMVLSITKAMVNVFFSYRLSQTIKKVIKEKFYYSNQDEIDRIVELTYWIMSDEDETDKKTERLKSKYERKLQLLFEETIQEEKVIHYDSVVNFRLNSFKDELLYIIGLAIDEFKREEDHQAFIDMLRKFIAKKAVVIPEVHIIQGKHFSFYKSTGEQFSNIELRMIMHKEPLYIVGLDIDELNLAPLVAMAPKKITIYGDNPSEPKTLTIINIFQEKVKFKSFNKFPFPRQRSNNI